MVDRCPSVHPNQLARHFQTGTSAADHSILIHMQQEQINIHGLNVKKEPGGCSSESIVLQHRDKGFLLIACKNIDHKTDPPDTDMILHYPGNSTQGVAGVPSGRESRLPCPGRNFDPFTASRQKIHPIVFRKMRRPGRSVHMGPQPLDFTSLEAILSFSRL